MRPTRELETVCAVISASPRGVVNRYLTPRGWRSNFKAGQRGWSDGNALLGIADLQLAGLRLVVCGLRIAGWLRTIR